ncbi:histidine phosphatase family protein [Paenibacillus wynnii]|uniref:histidine phosphatase family protein n=1 Tax=Paenibacillus wynnii TaxID=268407 RepID=UPI00278DC38F|nr:histidine phosphatase family protein [Paenibacillus wynnii]MDQ0195288.1 2,3-bisphosphoglycerate-dependent phosphoglycerate mutase [Paenibacillus wynnii]
MKTTIYMVRHGESPKTEGNERERGLTDKGSSDANRITELLKEEGIDVFVSSPYKRAILTIEELAQSLDKEIIVIEDLKEMVFLSEDRIMPDKELYPYLERILSDTDFTFPGGESSGICQKRAILILKDILTKYRGQKVAIGTHGLVMTLMMRYFDKQYDLNFLLQTSKPDIYRMELIDEELVETKKLWEASQ